MNTFSDFHNLVELPKHFSKKIQLQILLRDLFLKFYIFQVASGNKTVENWATKRLRAHYYIFSYPSLLKLHGEQSLLRNLDSLLGNEALLQLELKTLSPAFKDAKKQKWFEEVIDNYLKLWESNM